MSQVQVNKKKQKQHRRYEGVFDQAQTYDEGYTRKRPSAMDWLVRHYQETTLRLVYITVHTTISSLSLLPFWCGNVV